MSSTGMKDLALDAYRAIGSKVLGLITAVSAHARMPGSHHKHVIQKMVDMFVATRQACNVYHFKLSLRLKVVFSGMWLNSPPSAPQVAWSQRGVKSGILDRGWCPQVRDLSRTSSIVRVGLLHSCDHGVCKGVCVCECVCMDVCACVRVCAHMHVCAVYMCACVRACVCECVCV
jgi:hypothetical protein